MSPRHSSFIENKRGPIFRLSEYQELPLHLFLALATTNSHQLQLEIKPLLPARALQSPAP